MSIRNKIILLPVTIALLVVLMMGGATFFEGNKVMSIIHDRELDTAEAWLTASVERTHKVALSQAEVLASLPVVQKAVAEEDDMVLEELLGPGFAHMNAAAGVVQLQFHLAPATSLIRIHKLSKRGDDLSAFRHTVVDANASGKSLSGLERGRGGLGARGVAVIHYEGRPVGTVEVGLDVGMTFLEGLAARSGNDFELYMMPDTTIETFDAADQTDYRIGSTLERAPLLTSDDLGRLLTEDRIDRDLEFANGTHALRAVPIRDYSGNVAGVVTIIKPIESYHGLQRKLLIIALAAACIVLLIGTALGMVTGRILARSFSDVVDVTERLAAGDPTLDITGTERKDEIGGINRALKLFQEKLRENERLDRALKEEEAARRAHEMAEREREAAEAETRRRAEAEETERRNRLVAAEARTAQAEQAAAEERMREQQEVVELLAAGLNALAKGDLTHEIAKVLPGEYETLRLDFNRALAHLRETMHALNATADAIDTEVTAVAQASDDLSRRSERNAATLEQTAAALDELTASVHSAAESAAEAKRLSEDANQNADEGSASVERAVNAMTRIEESSAGIAKITTVIDEIAFQTNLLALNAGVEAARAGDAGRGFAVVASEVRALAQRSSEAAKEIGALIGSSENEVKQGVRLVHRTGDALEHILTSVRDISEQVIRIASSSEELAAGLGEINSAVNQLDATTQKNAAMFEETSAATAVLRGKSGDLVGAVRHFRIEAEGAATRPSPDDNSRAA